MTAGSLGPPVDILADRCGPLTRVAVLTGGRLSDLYMDRADRPTLLGAVFAGRVERIVAGLDAAFVDLGTGVSGLLAAADVRGSGVGGTGARGQEVRGKAGPARIGQCLRTGQTVLVQVKADAMGDKRPSLTMDVSLPGRFLVHVPFAAGVSVSKRLGPDRAALAQRIAEAVVGPGWIGRAVARGAGTDLLEREADTLAALWRTLSAAAAAGPVPRCLRPSPDALTRALVEHGAARLRRIAVEDAGAVAAVRRWADDAAPELAERIERHTGSPGLFEMADLDSALLTVAGRRVPLSGGASLVIDRTEALTVVDVNAGERAHPLDVNLEAADEVARQLRLRNVGGIVVVDFVNMRGRGDAERLLSALSQAVADDPIQTQVYGLSKLGLVEMTRARRGMALADLLDGLSPVDG